MKQRIITALIAAGVFITFIILGSYWFAGFIAIAALISLYELLRMSKWTANSLAATVGFASILYFVFPWEQLFGIQLLSFEASLWCFTFILLSVSVISKNRFPFSQLSILYLGVIYIAFGFHYMIETRLMDDGIFWMIFIFACVGMSDIGAYFTGMLMGKRLLWPAISPKKTIEGAMGGIGFSIVTALILSFVAPHLLSFLTAIGLGLIIAIAGQFGDLIQSAYKRAWGVKDSGKILPGHGGLLDRFDSWLIVFPMLHLLTLLP